MPFHQNPLQTGDGRSDSVGWVVAVIFAVTFLVYTVGAAALLLDRPN